MHYQHFGWTVSPYSQKTLAYIKFKNIPHENKAPNFLQLNGKIKKNVGKMIMPTVLTPEGQWWQDSAEIIDRFEKLYPDFSIQPEGYKQQITAHLFELIGDEWLIMPALQYRWTLPGNAKFAIDEFAKNGAPFLPKFLAKLVGVKVSKMMQAYMPRFGIVGETQKGVCQFTEQFIAQLDQHFAQHDFLLGAKPCIGDFALFGPLYAHLYRDPASTPLFAKAGNVEAWIKRLLCPSDDMRHGEFLADDQVPETLYPMLKVLFAEQFEFVVGVINAVEQHAKAEPERTKPSRIVGMTDFSIGGVKGRRAQFAFTQWKAQRSLSIYQKLSPPQQLDVQQWLSLFGGEKFAQLNIEQPLVRIDNKEFFAQRVAK